MKALGLKRQEAFLSILGSCFTIFDAKLCANNTDAKISWR